MSKPGTVFCKFHNYKDIVKVLQITKKLNGTNMSLNEDFSQETVTYRKKLRKEVKQLQSEDKLSHYCLSRQK